MIIKSGYKIKRGGNEVLRSGVQGKDKKIIVYPRLLNGGVEYMNRETGFPLGIWSWKLAMAVLIVRPVEGQMNQRWVALPGRLTVGS